MTANQGAENSQKEPKLQKVNLSLLSIQKMIEALTFKRYDLVLAMYEPKGQSTNTR
jgi:hypothetical protein